MAEEIDLSKDDERALDRVWGIADEVENQEHGHGVMLQSGPRNVRKHLHEGLEVADEIVGELQKATPSAMENATGEVMRLLAKAKDYTEARRLLQEAMPNLDREQLRNMLTGGMLIAQATGMQTVQQEVDGGRKQE